MKHKVKNRERKEQQSWCGLGSIPSVDFQLLFKSLPDPCLVLDPNLRIAEVNEAYLRATMTKREDILCRGLFEIFPDNPADPNATGVRNLRASLNRVLHNRTADAMGVQKYDIRRPEEQGGGFEERYWSPFNWPVFGPDNEIMVIVHRVQDVTEFVQMTRNAVKEQRSNQELHEQMEAEIYARSQEVAEVNLKLKQANDELARLYERTKELDKLKTQFFSNVSHELRTPLTLILGPAEKWLKTDEATEKQRHDLEVIVRNARLLLRHVNDLLDISKLEAGRMIIRHVDVNLSRFVRFIGLAFDSLAVEKHINYTVDTSVPIHAQIDPEKCQRIIINLLSNATKFTPTGGSIKLSLRTEDGRAVIRVRDTGPGVPEHMREAIFERFQQGEGGTERHFGGTGLGLAIVKDFVALHKGSVMVEDAPGGGALFTVSLPLTAPDGAIVEPEQKALYEEVEMQAFEQSSMEAHPAPTPEVSAGPDAPVVLVVDDNRDMSAFEADLLGRKYRVVTAFDGQEGLQKALEIHPDLVVSDVMMPRMSGDRMIQALRRHREMDDTPIILITAKADEEFLVKMLKEGVQAYFRKPFSSGELMAHADGLVKEKKLKGALRESEKKLLPALKELQRSNDELQQFAYAASHDLQEPLRTVRSYLELLAEDYQGKLGKKADTYITYAVDGASRMTALINDLLAYSRVGTRGKEFTPVLLSAILKKTLDNLGSAVKESNAEITADELPEVEGDDSQLRQLFQNLISNALKFRKKDERPRIRVSAEERANEWIFGVHDNGIGIENRFHENIFEIFRRLHTKEEYAGTGIGLALSKRIVERHGGRIWVESRPGEGSAFYFSLPKRE